MHNQSTFKAADLRRKEGRIKVFLELLHVNDACGREIENEMVNLTLANSVSESMINVPTNEARLLLIHDFATLVTYFAS